MKSMLLADKVQCILNGIPWLQNDRGVPAIKTTKTGVLWFDMDNGKRRTLDRLAAMGRHYGTPKDAPLYIVSCPAEGLNMREPEEVMRLQDTISADIGYVVVDNLGYVSGGADENTTQMVPVMGAFRALAERTGVAFEIIHHERKGNSLANERAGDKIRGSTSIEGALDRAFRAVRENGEDLITLFSVKERDQKIRPMGARFHFLWDENEELKEAWFSGEDSDTKELKTERVIMDFVGDGRPNQTDIINYVRDELAEFKVGKPTIVKALDWLVQNNRLVTETGGRGAILYRRPTDQQLSLDKFNDVVNYDKEIVPTDGCGRRAISGFEEDAA
jgi:hypothetical protein